MVGDGEFPEVNRRAAGCLISLPRLSLGRGYVGFCALERIGFGVWRFFGCDWLQRLSSGHAVEKVCCSSHELSVSTDVRSRSRSSS